MITILQPQDSVQVDRAIDTVKSAQLKVDATGSNSTAVLTVWNAATQVQIGTLTNSGGGKYTGTFTVSTVILSITLKSSLGGSATSPVVQK